MHKASQTVTKLIVKHQMSSMMHGGGVPSASSLSTLMKLM